MTLGATRTAAAMSMPSPDGPGARPVERPSGRYALIHIDPRDKAAA